MNIFVIHSGCDMQTVMERVTKEITEQEHRANILILENGGPLWKWEAYRLLKKSQLVLFFVGKSSYASKNIDWELKTAVRENKPLLYYKLEPENTLNQCLYGTDHFSKRKTELAEEIKSLKSVVEKIQRYEDDEYDVFTGDIEAMDRSELIEQYKIFLETSESLIARRQTVSSFYVSANTALITVLGALAAVFNEIRERIIMFLLISLVGIILSVSWHRILTAYGILNGSKMKVISMIEKKLPADLYDTEWAVMSNRLNGRKYVSFTDSEKKAPKAFIMLYCIFILIALLLGFRLIGQPT